MMRHRVYTLLLALTVLTGCASLPATKIPVCNRHADEACHAKDGDQWPYPQAYGTSTVNVCAWPLDTACRCDCYVPSGVADSRQLYTWKPCGR